MLRRGVVLSALVGAIVAVIAFGATPETRDPAVPENVVCFFRYEPLKEALGQQCHAIFQKNGDKVRFVASCTNLDRVVNPADQQKTTVYKDIPCFVQGTYRVGGTGNAVFTASGQSSGTCSGEAVPAANGPP